MRTPPEDEGAERGGSAPRHPRPNSGDPRISGLGTGVVILPDDGAMPGGSAARTRVVDSPAADRPRAWRRGVAVLGALAALAVAGTIGWMWRQSLLPDTYSVMDMGVPDNGGGPGTTSTVDALGHGRDHQPAADPADPAPTSVRDLTGPPGSPDVRVTLVARQQHVTLADGRSVDGFTLNGTTPGPTLQARQGDLVQVTLVNDSVPEGVTLHWHGVDVPNAEDGVAGVTQDAVGIGARHVSRFVASDPGTYWYHSHNVAHRQVVGGLFGVLVIQPDGSPASRVIPADDRAAAEDGDRQPPSIRASDGTPADVVAAVHAYDGIPTVNGRAGTSRVVASPGAPIRLRVVNTDNGPLPVAPLGVPFRVAAIDGRDLNRPEATSDRLVRVPAGGRADLSLVVPQDGSAVRIQFGADPRTALVVGPASAPEPPAAELPAEAVDLLGYGAPAGLGFDPASADRRFRYDIGRRPGFVAGRPGLFWTINGRLFPDVPMFMVAEGDVVVMTLSNSSGEVHPMHLHGHHAVVLSRNGVPASGSPWWVDSLDVSDGETYEIAFVADNPGVWMDHCHNLPHAAEGLVAHLMYSGVTTPYLVGGDAGNRPE